MCGHHPNLVKAGPQGPVTAVLLLYEVEFCTVLQAVNGGYHKETGRRVLWATHLCVVYKGICFKKHSCFTLCQNLPIGASQKFPMTFDLGTVPRGEDTK